MPFGTTIPNSPNLSAIAAHSPAGQRMRTHGVMLKACLRHDNLGLLTDQKIACVAPKAHLRCDVRHEQCLRVFVLDRNKPHRRAGGRFANRLRIYLVGLAPSDVPLT